MGNRIDENEVTGKSTESTASFEYHADGIDDGDGVEKCLDEDIPDRSDIAIFDIDSAEQKGDTKSKSIEFNDEDRHNKPRPAGSDTVKESEDDDNAEIDGEIDKSSGGGGNNNNPLWEANFTKEVTTLDDGLDSLPSAFGEEIPKHGAGQKVNRIVRDIATELEKLGENYIKNSEHQEWAKYCPKTAQN